MLAKCPVCQTAADFSPKFSITSREAAQHFVLAEEYEKRNRDLDKHIRELWGSSTCAIVQCAHCGLGFSWPFVAGDGEFYNLAYPHSDYPKNKWEYSTTIETLTTSNQRGTTVLEIGSGFGHFLQKISPRFFSPENVVAVEYNDTASASLRHRGYSVMQTDIRSSDFLGYAGSFDNVFMFQVLEHMDRLDELAKRLSLITREGANVFIAVPNSMRTEFNEQHRSLLDMPPNHISRWTERAFSEFAHTANFELVEYRREPMSWLEFLRQDLTYSYMRRSQRSGSIENRLRSRKRTKSRRLQEAIMAVGASPQRIRAWVSAGVSSATLGASLWVHLRRMN